MTDRTTKILLAVIALGLCSLFWLESDVSSIKSDVSRIKRDVSSIEGDVSSIKRDVSSIEDSTCTNSKIC